MRMQRTIRVASGLALLASCGSGPTGVTSQPGSLTAPPDTTGTRAVSGAPLFVLVDSTSVTTPDVRDRLARLRALPWAVSVQIARLAAAPDTLLTIGRAVAFDVAPGQRLVFAGDALARNATGSTSWRGVLQGGKFGDVHVVYGDSGVTATLRVLPPNGAVYTVQPLGSGLHAITQVDESRVPPPG